MKLPSKFREQLMGVPGGVATLDSNFRLVQRAGLEGKLPATFVIGTTASGHTENDVDYLCDGTADQQQINRAIQALPNTGGSILLLEGTYTCTAPILLDREAVRISGVGTSTLVIRGLNSNTSSSGMFSVTKPFCAILDLAIDGKGSGSGAGVLVNTDYFTAERVYAKSCAGGGVFINSGSYCCVKNCLCHNCASGIYIDKRSIAMGNIVYSSNYEGICARGQFSIIANNVCFENASSIRLYGATHGNVTGNVAFGSSIGIFISDSSGSTVAVGNVTYSNQEGITLGSTSSNCIIANNMSRTNSVTPIKNIGSNNTLGTNKT